MNAPVKKNTELTLSQKDKHISALVPSGLQELEQLAENLSTAMLVPQVLRGKKADIQMIFMQGMELGVPPMAAIRLIHVFDGGMVFAADLLAGLANDSDLCEYFRCVQATDEIATYETKRVNEDAPRQMSFTIKQAEKAGLLRKQNWQDYPAAMLRARAKAALARDAYPEHLAGLYTPDEVGHDIDMIETSPGSWSAAPKTVAPPAPSSAGSPTPPPRREAAPKPTAEPIVDAEIVEDEEPPPTAAADPQTPADPEGDAEASAKRTIDYSDQLAAVETPAQLKALSDTIRKDDSLSKADRATLWSERNEAIARLEARSGANA